MSSCDAFMVSSSGLFTENVYRRYFAKGKPEKHFVLVGRITSFLIVCGSIAFAFSFESIPRALEVFFQLQAMMGAAFWLGLFWRRTTVAGAWAGTLAALLVWFITGREFFHAFAVESLPSFMIWEEKFRVSWQILCFLTAAFASCIIVSLLTKRVPEAKLDKVFAALRTPIQEDEPHLAPFTLPDGVEPPEPRKLINHPDLEIPMPTLVGMGGFLFFWAMVGLMIWSVFFIVGSGQ
jgi:Na+/proline symporter